MDSPEEAATGTADAESVQHGYTSNKEAYLRRLKRIEGQVRGIARMVDEDKYCIDILTQVAAVNKALHAVSLGLVEEHIGHCVVGAAWNPTRRSARKPSTSRSRRPPMPSGGCCGNPHPARHTFRLIQPGQSGTTGTTEKKEQPMSPVSTTVNVSGMTCGHCISSVSEELEALEGVEAVDVDLNAGGISTVTITSDKALSRSEIGEAVAEAGYLVVANDA